MWNTIKAEQTKKVVCGYEIVKCVEENDCTGKKRDFWMLYNPTTDMEEAGSHIYSDVLAYAKAHPVK